MDTNNTHNTDGCYWPEPTKEEYEAYRRERRERFGPPRSVHLDAKGLVALMQAEYEAAEPPPAEQHPRARARVKSRVKPEERTRPIDLLRALGVTKIRQVGDQLHCCSPLRNDDRHPSFSMSATSGLWTDHGRNWSGNMTELLAQALNISTKQAYARLVEGDPLTPVFTRDQYIRKTDRCAGSKAEIAEQLKRAAHLLQTKMPLGKAVKVMAREFSISPATAYRRMKMPPVPRHPHPPQGREQGSGLTQD